MKIQDRILDDILVLKPTEGFDENGLMETLVDFEELKDLGIVDNFVQENFSYSKFNVLRGLHYQVRKPQGKLIRVLNGQIFDVAVDMRSKSKNFGRYVSLNLSDSENSVLWIPPGYAHGFYVLSKSAKVLYNVTEYRYPEFERVLLWSDIKIGINWPSNCQHPILSEKDKLGSEFEKADFYF